MVAILVACTFLGLVLADFGVQKWNAWQAARSLARPLRPAIAPQRALWTVPQGAYLSEGHTWVRPGRAGGLEIGVDSLIAHAIGAIRYVILPQPGDRISAGQPLLRLEKGHGEITIPSAITGVVDSVNSTLEEAPLQIGLDPYGKGWICRIIPTRLATEMPRLRFGEKAGAWLEEEFSRLREFLSVRAMPVLALGTTSQDGGLPAAGCLDELPSRAWSEFEKEFLKTK
jgi:glycine cleavage system H protein